MVGLSTPAFWILGRGEIVGLVVETTCAYLGSIAFPDRIVAGVRVEKIGRSSVEYGVGLFRNDEDAASAQGRFIHVYVDRATHRPIALPERWRAALAAVARD